LIVALSATAVAAPTISLSWYKNNGYGLGDDIGGEWTVTADVSSDVTRVEFYLDNQLQQNSTASPFQWNFNTADYSLGEHTIKAVAYNAEDQTSTTQADNNFVEYSTDFLWIILVVVIIAVAVSLVASLFWVRKKEAKKQRN
jgi:hypothetical protein